LLLIKNIASKTINGLKKYFRYYFKACFTQQINTLIIQQIFLKLLLTDVKKTYKLLLYNNLILLNMFIYLSVLGEYTFHIY